MALPLCAALVAIVAPASASGQEGGGRVSWWVEGRPWTCSDPVAPVARHTELACDATGGRCRVAQSKETADRVAVITCSARGDTWRLDAEDRDGQVLWSVSLTGDGDSRVRKAALWIARADSDGPLAAPEPADPAPSPAPAAVPPPAAAPDAEPPASPAPALAPAASPTAAEAPARPPPDRDGAGPVLTASFLAGAPLPAYRESDGLQALTGGRFAAAFRLMDDLFVGGAGDGMATVGVPYPGFVRATYAHMGGLVAIGAPYAREWIGASVEAGLSLTMLDEERPLPRAYGKGTVVLQLPRERGIRPYLALSYIGSNDGMNQTVAADLGLAWGSW